MFVHHLCYGDYYETKNSNTEHANPSQRLRKLQNAYDSNDFDKPEFRSTFLQMFSEISLAKNFETFTEKHLSWSLFPIKMQASANLIKIEFDTGVFL